MRRYLVCSNSFIGHERRGIRKQVYLGRVGWVRNRGTSMWFQACRTSSVSLVDHTVQVRRVPLVHPTGGELLVPGKRAVQYSVLGNTFEGPAHHTLHGKRFRLFRAAMHPDVRDGTGD